MSNIKFSPSLFKEAWGKCPNIKHPTGRLIQLFVFIPSSAYK